MGWLIESVPLPRKPSKTTATQPLSAEALAAAMRSGADLLVLLDTHFRRSAVGFASWDENLVCLTANDAFASLTSYTTETCHSQIIETLLPEIGAQLGPLCRSVLHSNQSLLKVEIADETTGRVWFASIYPTEVANAGIPKRAVGTVLAEITAQKQVERELSESVKALTADRDEAVEATLAKDRTLAWVAHEIATPMVPVLWTLTRLLKEPSTPEAMRPQLRMMLEAVRMQSALINDLRDATRIEAETLAPGIDPVDMHEVIHQALAFTASEIEEGRLAVTVELVAKCHHVSGDARRLLQVLWNLLRNAAKFSLAGGRVAVRTTNSPAGDCDSEFAFVVVEVRDDGAGIDPTDLERIFLPFEQGGDPEHRAKGLGLGLTISRALAELHGGVLTANSEGKGKGSMFSLKLPTIPAPLS